jgi:hypothetical protein
MLNIFHKGFCLAAVLLLAGLVGAQTTSSVTDSASDLPPADLAGWFGNGDSGLLFPTVGDPSQPWTSADNLATIAAWDDLVVAAEGDPALLAELTGLGMNSMSVTQMTSLERAVSGDSSVTIDSSGLSVESSATPEPALIAFLGGGLASLVLIAFARLRGPMAIIGSTCRAMKV